MDELETALRVLQKYDIKETQNRGFHFQRNDFYSPLNDLRFLEANRDLWSKNEDPLDIDWNLQAQLAVAKEISAFVEELRDIPQSQRDGIVRYCWQNGFWNNADALVQYGIVRSRKPGKYVEVGCGWSSLLLHRALQKNDQACEVALIEPYPNRAIFEVLPKNWVRHECILQRAPLRLFERGQTWNEQYLLQAFLMNNHSYRIMIANSYLFGRCASELDRLYKGVQPSWGASFWLEKL